VAEKRLGESHRSTEKRFRESNRSTDRRLRESHRSTDLVPAAPGLFRLVTAGRPAVGARMINAERYRETVAGGSVQAPIEIGILGTPFIAVGRTRATGDAIGGRRGAAVLARLVVAGSEPVHRELLAATVWGEEMPDAWRPALRNVITRLRRCLHDLGLDGEQVLRTVTAGYFLQLPEGASADLTRVMRAPAEVDALIRSGEAAGADALVAGVLPLAQRELLAGVHSPWVSELRQQVRQIAERLQLSASRLALGRGDLARAEDLARGVIAKAPMREEAYRLLMEALAAQGNRAAALHTYEQYRRLLIEQLGVNPAPQTEELFIDLLQETDPPEPDESVLPAIAALMVNVAIPMTGRDDVLGALEDLFDRAYLSGPRVAVVSGEAGIGKSRLAAELSMRLGQRGVPVLFGRAENRVDVPYRPFCEALQSYLTPMRPRQRREVLGPHAGALARLIPAARDIVEATLPSGIPDLDQRHLFDAMRHVLAHAAARRGAVVVLDDMHWGRAATRGFIEQLLSGAESLPLLIVALYTSEKTARADEAALREAAALRDTTMHRGDTVERVVVPHLSFDDVRELTRNVLGDRDDLDELTPLVWAESGGNPLFAMERLHWIDSGGETLQGDLAGGSIKSRMRELVQLRLGVLPSHAQRVLEVAAVAGLEFEPEVVIEACDLAEDTTQDVLAEAVSEGLLVPASSGPADLAFRHALVRSSLLDDLDKVTSLRLHRRIGEAMEGGPKARASHDPVLAYHFVTAAPLGDWKRAATYGYQVARAALDALVLDDAVRASKRVIEILESAGNPDPDLRTDLLTILGAAKRGLGDADANDVLMTAFDEAIAGGDPGTIAEVALAFAQEGPSTDEMYRRDAAGEVYQQALVFVGGSHPRLRARLLGHLAVGVGWTRDSAASRAYAEEALALARSSDDVGTLSSVLSNIRRAMSGTGRGPEARQIEDELLDLATRLDDPILAGRTWLQRFETATELGHAEDVDRAIEMARAGVLPSPSVADRHALGYLSAAWHLLRAEIDEADWAVERAAEIGRKSRLAPTIVEGTRLIQLMGVRYEQGRLDDLRDELAGYFATADVPEWQGATAFVDAELGHLDDVGTLLDEVFAGYQRGGNRGAAGVGFAAQMATPIARIGDQDRAGTLYSMLAPFAGQGGFATYLTCPIDWALGLCAETAQDETAAMRHFRAAARYATRVQAPRWVQRAQLAVQIGGVRALEEWPGHVRHSRVPI
jgi:DNA-binding SARP family transcriptional activator